MKKTFLSLVMSMLVSVFVLASPLQEALPAAVKATVDKYGGSIESTESYEDDEGKTVFDVEIKKDKFTYYLTIAEDGKLIAEEKEEAVEEGDEDTDGDW